MVSASSLLQPTEQWSMMILFPPKFPKASSPPLVSNGMQAVEKGGVGTPVVFAVIFFVIFFLLNNFGRKFVKEDVMQPAVGMWLATMVLAPIGFFLIYKALHDSQLFNKEF